MDVRLWPLASRIAEVEDMAVHLNPIRSLRRGVVNPDGYDFVVRASNKYTANGWIKKRLQKKYPYLTGIILDSSGGPLQDSHSISWARDTENPPEIIWCEPLEISLSAKDPAQFDLVVPFFKEIDAHIPPVAEKGLLWRKPYMHITTRPVILWRFDYDKFKDFLCREAELNGVNMEFSRKKGHWEYDEEDRDEYLLIKELIFALENTTDFDVDCLCDALYRERSNEETTEGRGREFVANYDRERVERLCKSLINGPRGVTLGREILEQLGQGFLNQSTYERLSRWVNPKRPEPFARGMAAEISILLFGEEIERTA
jgi:hypothetical protein